MDVQDEIVTDIEFKSLDGTVNVDEAQGIVECFVAAIGNKDSVGDVILPGAFTKSLSRRKPRVVWGHDWLKPIGKVLEMYEVQPGDPRLPAKMKQHGVGGLFAKVQFNLKSQRGREAFEDVLFFGMEQEWSIGYKTIDSFYNGEMKANMLKEVELFEASPVLHGANQLTSTISFKDAQGGEDEQRTILRGLTMARAFADDNPEFMDELKGFDWEKEVKAGEPNVSRGEIAGGRGPRRGNMEALLRYWRPIMKKPGGFRRCLVELADHPELGPLPNLCAWLHHETTGKWPNEGKGKGKSLNGDANPANGEWAALTKSLSQHFDVPVRLVSADSKSAIFEQDADDSVDTFSVKYNRDGDDFMFGTKTKVKPKVSYVAEDDEDDHDCGGDCGDTCCTGEKSEAGIETKIGRVLSSTNVGKLQQVVTILQEIIATGARAEVVDDEDVVVVKSADDELYAALVKVAAYHNGSVNTRSDGFGVKIASDKHAAAVANVVKAFGATTNKELV